LAFFYQFYIEPVVFVKGGTIISWSFVFIGTVQLSGILGKPTVCPLVRIQVRLVENLLGDTVSFGSAPKAIVTCAVSTCIYEKPGPRRERCLPRWENVPRNI